MSERRIVLVLGPGRSGTSSMAGSLASSGFHVPNAIRGNETNPVGFFEPRWVVNLHKQTLRDLGIGTLDPDPAARETMARANADPALIGKARTWLENQLEKNPSLVLKDPRLVWFRDLWVNAARDLGVEPGIVMMLRHPSEVSASRATYYSARDVPAVAGWINVALLSEETTADLRRQFVPYPDLLSDWRSQLTAIGSSLQVEFTPPVTDAPHPVDEVIDPSLRRMASGWDDVAVPAPLADLADRVHDALVAETTGDAAEGTFAALRAEYDDMFEAALTMTSSRTRRSKEAARAKALDKGRRAALAEAATAAAAATPPPSLVERVKHRIRALR